MNSSCQQTLKHDPQLGAWEKRVPLVEPKNGVSNHEMHESHEKRTTCNAMSVHPAGERPSVGISLSFRVFRVFRGFNCCFQGYQTAGLVPAMLMQVSTCFVRCFGAPLQPLAEVGLGLLGSGRQQVQQRGQPGFSPGLRLVLDFLKLRAEPDQP